MSNQVGIVYVIDFYLTELCCGHETDLNVHGFRCTAWASTNPLNPCCLSYCQTRMHPKDQLIRNQMDDTTRMEPVKHAKSIAVYLENPSCENQADTLQGYLFGNPILA